MKDIMSFWLDLDVAGFRVDAFNHMFEDPQFRDEPTNSWANENTYDYTTHIYTKDLVYFGQIEKFNFVNYFVELIYIARSIRYDISIPKTY